MKQIRAQALARLRAADPAADPAAVGQSDPNTPEARAMLDRVLMAQDEQPRVAVRSRRRLVVGLAGAAAVAVVTTLAVLGPWPGGEPASAYNVDRHADGSLAVTIRAARLTDTAKLNAELARQGARTTVMAMVPADRCPTPAAVDPRFELRPGIPVDYEQAGNGSVLIVIKPWNIPAGDALVIGYTIRNDREGRTTLVRPVVVTSAPSCLAIPSLPLRS